MVKSQALIRKLEHWESEVKIAHLQGLTLKENFHIFENNLNNVIKRFENWLKTHEMETSLDLNYYKTK